MSEGIDIGRRALAAIVFSDAVDFSAHASRDEVTALRWIERDLARMREICVERNGQVLKSTGDGLLMKFGSAVDAVRCATELSRSFAPSGELKHRFGVHVGDVVITDDDVLGDGVNVAARLQALAPAGGVAISQTTYETVRGKLDESFVDLGSKRLKNIEGAVRVWAYASDRAAITEPRKRERARWLPWALTGLLAVIAVAAVAFGIGASSADEADPPVSSRSLERDLAAVRRAVRSATEERPLVFTAPDGAEVRVYTTPEEGAILESPNARRPLDLEGRDRALLVRIGAAVRSGPQRAE